ncbi:MAG: hypothetical protein BroJett011_47860 [Chloroflexota bacterium]|nr:MAG: hypothetical protein BroJett011_47860 [Chloroflexota bacterium]
MSKAQTYQEAWFRPMGFTLRLRSNSPAIIAAAETSFGRFGPGQSVELPDFRFRLMASDRPDSPPDPPSFRLEGSLLYQTIGRDSGLVANLADGFAFGYFSAPVLANPAFFRWHFLELAFLMMLEWRGWMGVHGAALAKNGQAVLLRAQSGGGKTTLAFAAAMRGSFQALAEDVVWLDSQRHLWWGMPWSFHLLPDAKKLFPELTGYEPVLQTNGEMKLEVNLESIRPGSTTVSAQPKAVILVERLAGGKSWLEPVQAAEARRVWPLGATGLEMKLPHHSPHLESLFQHKTYRLYFGDDIQAGVELLETVFEA